MSLKQTHENKVDQNISLQVLDHVRFHRNRSKFFILQGFSFLTAVIKLKNFDGFIHYILNRCLFNSSDLKDIENIYSYYYNKEEFLRFSSSSGKFVGYTELGVKTAERANNDPEQMSSRRAEKETICKPNIDGDYSTILTKSVQPRVRVQSLEPSGGNHPAMLICSIYDFYPKKIKVSWLQDQEEVSSDVTSTAEMEDGDWFYQIHSYLEYTIHVLQKYSCVVEVFMCTRSIHVY
uniref:Ig-like domain-containing protein n=1 Tax=Oryzias sinensis TaxID=183150 RepID=A0A8C7X327_9TELE